MKKLPEQPAPSDADLFRQSLDGVTPITHSNRIAITAPTRQFPASTPAITPQTISDNWSDHGAEASASTAFLRDGLNRMTLRKLRRGHWPIQDSIDLHGYTSEEARRALLGFLQHAMRHQYRCVAVIHGKGWRAEGGEGILKTRVRHWLTQHAPVLAFCETPPHAGGGGAVWVMLKSEK